MIALEQCQRASLGSIRALRLVMRVLRYSVVFLLGVGTISEPVNAQTSLRSRVYASGLNSPVAFVQDPTNTAVQFVVEQGGRIRVIQSGIILGTDFLDLRGAISSGGERGLLGLAFAPDYASSGRFYVNFTDPAGNTVVARFRRATSTPPAADPASRFDLRWRRSGLSYIPQPYANHNGGNLAFGPDGYLYIGLGDGGSGNDPENRAQNPAEPLGKMLRIDVNVADTDANGYVVPPTNPFVSGGPAGVLPEIWSFGLRNPWRYSFDPPSRGGTGALIIADVGQGAWEEIDFEPAGRGGRTVGETGKGPIPTSRHLRPSTTRQIWLTRSTNIATRSDNRSPAGSCIAAPRCRRIGAATFSLTTFRATCGHSGSSSIRQPARRALPTERTIQWNSATSPSSETSAPSGPTPVESCTSSATRGAPSSKSSARRPRRRPICESFADPFEVRSRFCKGPRPR
jgi:hypothetical protein